VIPEHLLQRGAEAVGRRRPDADDDVERQAGAVDLQADEPDSEVIGAREQHADRQHGRQLVLGGAHPADGVLVGAVAVRRPHGARLSGPSGCGKRQERR
jgi:hypothetical protein